MSRWRRCSTSAASTCSSAYLLLDVSAVAAVGRTRLSFVVAFALAVPAGWFHLRAIVGGDASHLLVAWSFAAALYVVTIGYLRLGVLWALLYAITDQLEPGSFATGGAPASLTFPDLLYFSFTSLTSTGFGDIVPLLRRARALCVLEQLMGGLFIAILIARLAGVYPPGRERR